MGTLVRITAEEARDLMEASTKMLSWIYKSIREAAEEGCYTLRDWPLRDCTDSTIEKIMKVLQEDGFIVELVAREYDTKPTTLRISW